MRIILLSFLVFSSLHAASLPLETEAESAILMNAETGAILFEKNAHTPQYPASITKIATAAYVLNGTQAKLTDRITAPQEAVASISEEAKRRSNYTLPSYWLVPGASHIGIKKGEVLTLKDLLYGMMVASGDDASNVIAYHIGGTIPDFMDQLNAYLVSIGCKESFFNNPHGLFHPKQQTTAYDMAILTQQALKNPTFREIVATPSYTRPKTNMQEATPLVQTNKLLRKGKFYYPKAIGVKTGYIAMAQNTFVGAAQHNNRTLIVVFFRIKERDNLFKEAIKFFDAAFSEVKVKNTLLTEGPQAFELILEGAKEPVQTYSKESVIFDFYPSEEPKLKTVLIWDPVTPPIAKDQRVGELRFETPSGAVIRQVPLYAQEEVKSTWTHWLKHLFG